MGRLQPTACLSLAQVDLTLPWLPSSHQEEGLPDTTMGFWWEQFHGKYVGSETGEGMEL